MTRYTLTPELQEALDEWADFINPRDKFIVEKQLLSALRLAEIRTERTIEFEARETHGKWYAYRVERSENGLVSIYLGEWMGRDAKKWAEEFVKARRDEAERPKFGTDSEWITRNGARWFRGPDLVTSVLLADLLERADGKAVRP